MWKKLSTMCAIALLVALLLPLPHAMALESNFNIKDYTPAYQSDSHRFGNEMLNISGQALFIGDITLQVGDLPSNPFINFKFSSDLGAIQAGALYMRGSGSQGYSNALSYSYNGVTLQMKSSAWQNSGNIRFSQSEY